MLVSHPVCTSLPTPRSYHSSLDITQCSIHLMYPATAILTIEHSVQSPFLPPTHTCINFTSVLPPTFKLGFGYIYNQPIQGLQDELSYCANRNLCWTLISTSLLPASHTYYYPDPGSIWIVPAGVHNHFPLGTPGIRLHHWCCSARVHQPAQTYLWSQDSHSHRTLKCTQGV